MILNSLVRFHKPELIVEFGLEQGVALDMAALGALPGVRHVTRENGHYRLSVTDAAGVVPALLAELQARGLTLGHFATHHATLEDVFVALTGRHLRDD